MAVIFFDGFDDYSSSANFTANGGWTVTSRSSPSTAVRVGSGKSIQLLVGSSYLLRDYIADQAGKTLYNGFAFSNSGGYAASSPLFSYHQTAGETPQLHVDINTANKIEITRGATILATSTFVLTAGVWNYIELKTLIASSGGVCEVKVNGNVVVSYTGNTQNQGTNSVLRAGFGWLSSGYTAGGYIDDVYFLNSDGSANNTYAGEQRIEIMHPNADSSVTWSRNTGTSNYAAISEAIGSADDNTTYVYSGTSGQVDAYGLSDLSGVNTVAAVKVVTRAEKDDVNPLSLNTGIKSGSTNQYVTHTLGIGYANFIDIFETSDGGSTAFTATTVNSLLSTVGIP